MLRTAIIAMCALLAACKDPEPSDPTGFANPEETTTSATSTGTTAQGTTDGSTDAPSDPSTSAPGSTSSPGSTGTSDGTTAVDTTAGSSAGSTSTTAGASSTTAGASTGGGGACVPVDCSGAVYACGDCTDNDGDGKVDLADPECVSPCDDREDTFATGLPGDNMDPCKQDCFFDGNSGGGKNDCAWNLKCDPMSPGGDKCPYDAKYANCPDTQPQACIDSCQVPNGCDCFGCCTVEVDGVAHDVFLGDPDCSVANIDGCAACTKNPDCADDCDPGACEVCFGQTEPPPGCDAPSCDSGQSCTIDPQGNSDCPEGYYCATGCCFMIQPG